jgi:hypothetical protein
METGRFVESIYLEDRDTRKGWSELQVSLISQAYGIETG